VKSVWREANLIQKKTDAGYLQVSSPALTAFDLLLYHKKIGGLNRIGPILEDLTESIKVSDLNRTAKGQKNPEVQRLGYLLEQMGNEKLAAALHRRLAGKALREIPLSLSHKNREGVLNKKWKIILNTELDF
jgi:predicted transcriptional regulator of viral defense system